MGDAQDTLALVVMHSVVYSRAKKNNLIDFVSDSVNPNAERIPTFLGRRVVIDDATTNNATIATTATTATTATIK